MKKNRWTDNDLDLFVINPKLTKQEQENSDRINKALKKGKIIKIKK